jgi:CDP-glucose 4,6-dehydratase
MISNYIEELRQIEGPVLITGHTGFKGTWMTLLLERLGVEVVGYSLAPTETSLFNRLNRRGIITEVFQDIRDTAKLNEFFQRTKPKFVIHMAAQPLVLESYKNPFETFEVSAMGTVNVLEAAFKTKSVEVVGVVTTDKVYRNNGFGNRFIEQDELEGEVPYSASKVTADAAVAAWKNIQEV